MAVNPGQNVTARANRLCSGIKFYHQSLTFSWYLRIYDWIWIRQVAGVSVINSGRRKIFDYTSLRQVDDEDD